MSEVIIEVQRPGGAETYAIPAGGAEEFVSDTMAVTVRVPNDVEAEDSPERLSLQDAGQLLSDLEDLREDVDALREQVEKIDEDLTDEAARVRGIERRLDG